MRITIFSYFQRFEESHGDALAFMALFSPFFSVFIALYPVKRKRRVKLLFGVNIDFVASTTSAREFSHTHTKLPHVNLWYRIQVKMDNVRGSRFLNVIHPAKIGPFTWSLLPSSVPHRPKLNARFTSEAKRNGVECPCMLLVQ
jgi:hypothetical protein